MQPFDMQTGYSGDAVGCFCYETGSNVQDLDLESLLPSFGLDNAPGNLLGHCGFLTGMGSHVGSSMIRP